MDISIDWQHLLVDSMQMIRSATLTLSIILFVPSNSFGCWLHARHWQNENQTFNGEFFLWLQNKFYYIINVLKKFCKSISCISSLYYNYEWTGKIFCISGCKTFNTLDFIFLCEHAPLRNKLFNTRPTYNCVRRPENCSPIRKSKIEGEKSSKLVLSKIAAAN